MRICAGFLDRSRQSVGLQSVARNCKGELRGEELTVLGLEVAVFLHCYRQAQSFLLTLNIIIISIALPTCTQLSGSGQGFPMETPIWGNCCTQSVNCEAVSSGVSLRTDCLCRDQVWCWSKLHLLVSFVLVLAGTEKFGGRQHRN